MDRKALIAILFTILLSTSSLTVVFRQAAAQQATSTSITVWIPPVMLAGEKYQGMVIMTEEGFDREILLVSDNPEVVRVPERVTLGASIHQATFDIEVAGGQLPRQSVPVSVSAVVPGGLAGKASATVYDSSSTAGSVRMLAFEKTVLSFARVVVVPEKTAYGPEQADVILAYPGGTIKVSIDGRTGYGVADVPLPVVGENRISVFNKPGGSITVTRAPADPAVTVNATALSTIPAWTPEWGYLTSWVLVDAESDGKPIRGNFTAIMTSSNPDVVQVENERIACQLPCAIPVRGYAEGDATVGVYVTGAGSDSASIKVVRPARYSDFASSRDSIASYYISKAIGPSANFVLNSTTLSGHTSEKAVSSAVTDGPVYGMVGHYATLVANYTTIQTTVSGNTTTTTTTPGTLSKTLPLVIPGVRYYGSSDKNTVAVLGSGYFAGLLQTTLAHSDVMAGGWPATANTAPFGIGSSHAAMSSFSVRLDEHVGPAELRGELTVIGLDGTDIRLAGYVSGDALRGYAADMVGNKGVFTSNYMPPPPETPGQGQTSQEQQTIPQQDPFFPVQQDPFFPVQQQLPQQQQQIQAQVNTDTKMDVSVPPLLYPAEGFVFAAHVTQGGVPVQRAYPLHELGKADPDLSGEIQEIDSVFMYDRYVETVKMKVVMNTIGVTVDWPDVLKLGRQMNVTVTSSVPGAKVTVSGDVRGGVVSIQEDKGVATVALYPAGAEGDRKAVISVSKQGWVTSTAEKVIPAREYRTLTIGAIDTAGSSSEIHAPFTLTYTTIDASGNLPNQNQNTTKTVTGVTPYVLDERPLVSKSVIFGGIAAQTENSGTQYSYTGRTTDSGDRITGLYDPQARVVVTGGSGSGYYSAGQQVQLEAGPDRQVLGFAVVEKFSHWEYDSNYLYMRDASARSQYATVAAVPGSGQQAVEVAAVYATDYSLLAVLVISTVAAVGAYAYRSEIRTIIDTYRRKEKE